MYSVQYEEVCSVQYEEVSSVQYEEVCSVQYEEVCSVYYEEVCSGTTGHNEVVIVVFDPKLISYNDLLKVFWESHNPTQGMQQGNDRGTQYRSGIYTYDEQQLDAANSSKQQYQDALKTTAYGDITTEVLSAPDFYFAEVYHQQYLAKNPNGYCGLGGTGICLPG